jgi:hypothetical protein
MKKQEIAMSAVNSLLGEVRNGNTVAGSALGAKLARAMGEVGVLTEQDVTRYSQSGALGQKLADKLHKLVKGTPTDMTVDEIEAVSRAISNTFQAAKGPIQSDYVTRMARSYGIPEDRAAYLLNVPTGASQAPSSPAQGGGTNAAPIVGGMYDGKRVKSVKRIK